MAKLAATTKKEKLRRKFADGGLVTVKEMRGEDIPSAYFSELEKEGAICRVARGIYASDDRLITEHADYQEAALSVPNGVFSFFSALRIHGLTDENPHQLHMTIPFKSHPPKTALPMVFYYASPAAYSHGIEALVSCGVEMKVYSIEKTIVDCFKARNKIGLDIAVKAMREAYEKKQINNARLWAAAKICRMAHVMRPYMEAFA